MQVIKLVKGGTVDKLIAFDSLPKSLMSNVRRAPLAGLPRHWKELFKDLPEKEQMYPFHYLEYVAVNSDKETWQEISQYVRRVTDKTVRLLDKLEDMAIPMAPDSTSELRCEPEDIPVIPIPQDATVEESHLIKESELTPKIEKSNLPKRRGPHKKILVAI